MGPLRDHYDLITSYYRRLAAAVCLALFAAGCSAGGQGGDVDLSTAIPLLAVPAPTPSQFKPGEGPGSPAIGQPDNTPLANLFSLPPGQFAPMASMAGTIDPVGTSLPQDFDGDGILNDNETTSNFWVADYPVIEANIATPVTLKIEILQSTTQSNDEIVSEITSDDYENNRTEGTEKAHRNEVNLRTVQYRDEYFNDNSTAISIGYGNSGSRSRSYSGQYGETANDGSGEAWQGATASGSSKSLSLSLSWEQTRIESGKVTKWADRPFRNNLDRDAWSLKSNNAATKARKFRQEKQSKVDETSVVESNAGFVRAALYIKNLSTNMPVRLSNILASLMFENAEGELIPVQSFFLRNDDYSPFEVDVYGGTEFGPYVIALEGLNTVEVENAIARGYTPKIFIADYDMAHVPDSNYRSSLLNYSGDNVKIIEENAKGRTARVKLFAPGVREMYRVSAFSTDGTNPDKCSGDQGTQAAPGISLLEALERIQCSGVGMEFGDYVIDLGDALPELDEYKLHLTTIKRIGAHESNFPCTDETHTGSDGVQRTACVQKPLDEWTQEEIENNGVWVVFSDARYYNHTEYVLDSGAKRYFNTPAPGEVAIPMIQGINSRVWAGDHFEIFYLTYGDFVRRVYGADPFERPSEPIVLDTIWNSQDLGTDGFDPDVNSQFLGQAGFGEKIELRIKLTETAYLDPNFGTGTATGSAQVYDAFTYNPRAITSRFNLSEVADFEISMGFGGERSDWFHVMRDLAPGVPEKPSSCGTSLDFVNQEFYLCIALPTAHPYVDPDSSLINVYLRPSLNAGYRESVWPLPFDEVRRFRSLTRNAYDAGETTIELETAIGQVIPGDDLYFVGDTVAYDVATVSESSGVYTVTLNNALTQDVERSQVAYVLANVSAPNVELSVENGFLTDWNLDAPAFPDVANWRTPEKAPLLASDSQSCSPLNFNPVKCLGFSVDYVAGNWLGNNNVGVPNWNAWADAGDFVSYLADGLPTIVATSGKSMRFLARGEDVPVSLSNSGDQQGVRTVTFGNSAFSVWRDSTSGHLVGRVVDVSTGQPVGSEIAISTVSGPFADYAYSVDVSDSLPRAVVVWGATNSIPTIVRARVIDLATGSTVGSEFDIHDATFDANGSATVSVSGSKAVFAWIAGLSTSPQKEVFARVYDVGTGTFDSAQFQVSQYVDIYKQSAQSPAVGISGNRALVAWTLPFTGEDRAQIRTRFFDIPTASLLGSAELQLTPDDYSHGFAKIAVSGDYGIVAWRHWDGNGTTLTRSFRFSTASPVTTSNVIVTLPELDSLAASGSRVILAGKQHSPTQEIVSVVQELTTGLVVGSPQVSLSAITGTTPWPFASVAAYGSKALVVWHSSHSGDANVYGSVIDLTTATRLNPPAFPINTVDLSTQALPSIHFAGQQGFVAWQSNDNGSDYDIRGRNIDIEQLFPVPFGLNNFFSAPLIRRLYEVRANIQTTP